MLPWNSEKRPTSNCSQQTKLTERWWRKRIIDREECTQEDATGSQRRHMSGAQHCARPHRGHFGGRKRKTAPPSVTNLVSRLSETSVQIPAPPLVSFVVQGKLFNLSGPQCLICNTEILTSLFEKIEGYNASA